MYFFLQIEIDVASLPEDVACLSQKRKAIDQEPISNCKRAHHALVGKYDFWNFSRIYDQVIDVFPHLGLYMTQSGNMTRGAFYIAEGL